jgi:glucose/arabinose dehydrogenase
MSLARLFVLFALLPVVAAAQQFDLRLTPVATELPNVVDIVHAGDGSGRLYLVRQDGRVYLLQGGQRRAELFADLRQIVETAGAEQGLLSLAFMPGFPTPPQVFAWYVAPGGDTVLARFTVDPAALVVDAASVQELLRIGQPFENHNGGKLLFGSDGMLYLSTGDGGGSGDPSRTAQDLGSLLGKILRLDVRSLPYAVPADNPFVGVDGARPEIWAYGLRNPWKMSFDRATGELWIADVGQARREEINLQPAGVGGQNWGWSCLEGTLAFANGDDCRGSGPVPPVAEYGRADGCSITGGSVYRGSAYPNLHGVYLAGDYCSGRIFGYKHGSGGFDLTTLADTPHNIASFGEDEAGNIYVAGYFSGVYLLSDGEPQDATPIDGRQVGSQYWLTGSGMLAQRVLSAELSSATGTAFGSGFDPAQIVRRRWGSLEIEFTGCDRAILRWDSSGPDSAGFGSGGYPLQRIAASADSQRCNQVGFGAIGDETWVTGTWFGGAARDGEGVFLERLANGVVLVAFFTHRPAGVP